jgi:hypothetical protein
MTVVSDPVTRQLAPLFACCRSSTRQRRIQSRWLRYPTLAGTSVDDVVAVLGDPNRPDHNAVCADLLRAHQHGDHDATVVLLVACRPLVLAVVQPRHGGDQFPRLWAAVAKALATTDPDDVAAGPKPFLVTLIGRIRRDSRRQHQSQARALVPTGFEDTSVAVQLDRVAARSSRSGVEDHAIARLFLRSIGDQLRQGALDAEHWQQLVRHSRLELDPAPRGPSDSRLRMRILRLRRELADSVGYAA